MLKEKIRIFSFFSGVGFLDLGFESEGYEIAYANEIEPSFLHAYKYSRQKLNTPLPAYGYYDGSITDFFKPNQERSLQAIIKSNKKEDAIIGFIGGPPCPDFSIGGKNKGKHGENGKLSLSYVNLIIRHKPDFFLFENVKGLWKTKRHRKFYEQLKLKLLNAGYILTDKLINATEYGAPQDRDRILLFGVLRPFAKKRGYEYGKSSLIPADDFNWYKHAAFPDRRAFNYPWPHSTPFKENSSTPKPSVLPEELTIEYWFKKNKVKNHANQEHCFKPRAGLRRFLTVEEGDVSKKCFKRPHRWRYSPTACYGNNEVHLHPYKARRLTVAETLAIQSLPYNYELPKEMTLTDMFKSIGNGVPFLVSQRVAKTIKEYVRGE